MTAIAAIPLALLLGSTAVFAHCDGIDGPVVKAARQALDTGNANVVLIWVQKNDDEEIKNAFQKAVGIRKLSPAAKEMADNYFFETSVAKLARERGLSLVSDLGAGALLDLRRWGLPYEHTPAEMRATVTVETGESQIGSGSLPADRLPSFALAIRPMVARRQASARVEDVSRLFRALPMPLIGRVHDGVLYFDLRCLDDEDRLLKQLVHLPEHAKRH